MSDSAAKPCRTRSYFPNQIDDHEDSEICSPPLWRTSPSSSPYRRQNSYRSLSPTSKAQAIARGQKELMEMISKMPESCYELTLKDLVEVNANQDESKVFDEIPQRKEEKKIEKTKSDVTAQMNRNRNTNNGGFLLKMVLPFNLGSNKKKKNKRKADSPVTSKGSRVSPRPSMSDASAKADDKDGRNKIFSELGESESESGVSSINSGSTKSNGSSSSSSSHSRNTIRNTKGGCWSFLRNLHSRDRTS